MPRNYQCSDEYGCYMTAIHVPAFQSMSVRERIRSATAPASAGCLWYGCSVATSIAVRRSCEQQSSSDAACGGCEISACVQ